MNELQITEYKNIRVLTTQQIAEAYGSDTRVISNNFNRNKDRYVEGKHYICLEDGEKREFVDHHQIDDGSKKASKLYLWTEKGAFLHAKSLNTDMAWEVYDRLVDNYFEKPKAVPMTTDQKIQLLAQGNVELTERIDKVDKDLQEFKADMPLLALECQRITRAKNQKVVPLMGGKSAPAYKNKSLMHKVYSDVDAQLVMLSMSVSLISGFLMVILTDVSYSASRTLTDTSLLVTPCSFRSFLIACDNSLFVMVLFSFRALSHRCR